MNKEKATEAVRDLMSQHGFRAQRLDRINEAMQPWTAARAKSKLAVSANSALQHPLDKLTVRSQTNFLPLILDQFSQSMKVSDYYGAGAVESADPWKHWQRNSLDARQTGIHRAALQYGEAYAVVLPGMAPSGAEAVDGVQIRGVSPRRMAAWYGESMEWANNPEGPVDEDWPLMAVEINDRSMRLYDDEFVYFFGVKSKPRSVFDWTNFPYNSPANFEFIEARRHGVGVCPVVRFRDRQLLAGEESLGIIEPLMMLQDRIDETTFEMSVAQYWGAFKQRYVMGWMPENEHEAFSQTVADTMFFKDPDTKAGQFAETALEPYISSKNSAVRDMAAIAQVPAQNLGADGVSNVSAEGLAALESARDRKATEIEVSLGESWEQVMRTAAFIEGDMDSAEDFTSEVKWADVTARSFAQVVDGLGKLAQMLDVPTEALLEDIPGWDRGRAERVKAIREREREAQPAPVFAPESSPQADVSDGAVTL